MCITSYWILSYSLRLVSFADDCVLYKSGKNWGLIFDELQRALNKYVKWGEDHNLKLNVSKTKAMCICNSGRKGEIDATPL